MHQLPSLFVLLFFLSFGTGCQTSEEKAHDAIMNFVMADAVHAAPYRSYLFVSEADKAAMTADAYAAWHDKMALPDDTEVEIEALELDQNSGSATVRVGAEESGLTLVKEDDRWRIHLDLSAAVEIEKFLDSARRATDNGDLERALELLDKAEGIPIRGSLGPPLDLETADLRAEVEEAKRERRVESLIEASRKADLDTLEGHLAELESYQIERIEDELSELRVRLTELRRAHALENLELEESKVRRFYAGNNIVFEVDLTLANASDVPIRSATLNLTMLQRGEPLGTRAVPLVFEPALHDGAPQPMTVAVPDGPVEWRSREFDHEFSAVEIVDE